MRAFYELHRDIENKLWVVNRDDYEFPLHFHASVEVFILHEGQYKIRINDDSFEMNSKSVVIFDSYSIHSLKKIWGDTTENTLIMIPSSLLYNYTSMKNGQFLENNLITDPVAFEEICTIGNLIKSNQTNKAVLQPLVDSLFARSIVEVGLSNTSKQNSFSIIKNILEYIELNFREEINLNMIATHFGYTACHLSRVFHSYLKMSISQYINNLRIEWIELNKNGDKKLLTLIYEAGFNSPQTYYRNLKTYRATHSEQ